MLCKNSVDFTSFLREESTMASFEKFKSVHGPPMGCQRVTQDTIVSYRTRLPTELLDEWDTEGFCGYANGLIWFTNPKEFDGVLVDWLGELSDSAITIFRTAFGGLYIWLDGKVRYLDVLYGRLLSPLTSKVSILLNYTFCQDSYLDKVWDRKLYLSAASKLGIPKHDECYAFVPALAVGGPGTVDTLQKVKLREHLGLLAQLTGDIEVFD